MAFNQEAKVIIFLVTTGLLLGSLLYPLHDLGTYYYHWSDVVNLYLYLISGLLLGTVLVCALLQYVFKDPNGFLFRCLLSFVCALEMLVTFPYVYQELAFKLAILRILRGIVIGSVLAFVIPICRSQPVCPKAAKIAFGVSTAVGFLATLTLWLVWFLALDLDNGYENVLYGAHWVVAIVLFGTVGCLIKPTLQSSQIEIEGICSANKCP